MNKIASLSLVMAIVFASTDLYVGGIKSCEINSSSIEVDCKILDKNDVTRKDFIETETGTSSSGSSVTNSLNLGKQIADNEKIQEQYEFLKMQDIKGAVAWKDENGITALMIACELGDIDFVENLLKEGINKTIPVDEDGKKVKYYVNWRNNQSETALMKAARLSNPEISKEIIKKLIKYGADTSVKNKKEVFQVAKSADIVSYIEELDQKRKELMTACAKGFIRGLLDLINKDNIDVNMRNKDGWSGLDLAIRNGRRRIVGILFLETNVEFNENVNLNDKEALNFAMNHKPRPYPITVAMVKRINSRDTVFQQRKKVIERFFRFYEASPSTAYNLQSLSKEDLKRIFVEEMANLCKDLGVPYISQIDSKTDFMKFINNTTVSKGKESDTGTDTNTYIDTKTVETPNFSKYIGFLLYMCVNLDNSIKDEIIAYLKTICQSFIDIESSNVGKGYWSSIDYAEFALEVLKGSKKLIDDDMKSFDESILCSIPAIILPDNMALLPPRFTEENNSSYTDSEDNDKEAYTIYTDICDIDYDFFTANRLFLTLYKFGSDENKNKIIKVLNRIKLEHEDAIIRKPDDFLDDIIRNSSHLRILVLKYCLNEIRGQHHE